jgi:hypothetical protein
VAEFFSAPEVTAWMVAVDYRPLAEGETREAKSLLEEYMHIEALTNPEMRFIVGLFERRE